MAQFYTLEEAARVLGMSPEDLKAKAQQREVRAFLDGGSWRFRVVRRRRAGPPSRHGQRRRAAALRPRHARRPQHCRRRHRPLRVPARRSPSPTSAPPTVELPASGSGSDVRTTTSCSTTCRCRPTRIGVELGDHRHADDGRQDAERLRRPAGPRQPPGRPGRAIPTSGWRASSGRPSDSDVRLAGQGSSRPSDSDVTLIADDTLGARLDHRGPAGRHGGPAEPDRSGSSAEVAGRRRRSRATATSS